jgi:hypothetical protein
MKRLLFIFAVLVLMGAVAFSQANVKTESASNLFRSYTGTASQDTLKGISVTRANSDSATVKYLVRINVNYAVASDSIFVWEATNVSGARYFAKIIIPSTAPAPFSIDVGCKVDSGYVIVKRYKTSDVSLIYRLGF